MEGIQIVGISLDDFTNLLRKEIRAEIQTLHEADEWITQKQASSYCNVEAGTIITWESSKPITVDRSSGAPKYLKSSLTPFIKK